MPRIVHRLDNPLVLEKADLKGILGVTTDVGGTIVDSRRSSLGTPWPGAVELLEDMNSIFGPIVVIEHAPRFYQTFGRSFHEYLDGPELNLSEICPRNLRLECGYVTTDRPDCYYVVAKRYFGCAYEELMVITDHYPHALGALHARAGLVVLSRPPIPQEIIVFWEEYGRYLKKLPADDYFARDESRIAIVDGLQCIQFDESVLELIPK